MKTFHTTFVFENAKKKQLTKLRSDLKKLKTGFEKEIKLKLINDISAIQENPYILCATFVFLNENKTDEISRLCKELSPETNVFWFCYDSNFEYNAKHDPEEKYFRDRYRAEYTIKYEHDTRHSDFFFAYIPHLADWLISESFLPDKEYTAIDKIMQELETNSERLLAEGKSCRIHLFEQK